ncbi:succinylglutamate desuccinylase [Burkholderia sp. Leaf177]|uniref:M14 family metallopeptidase n=1 Tax=Burkholderia sp. Leaf177 TaxID=1736287 RepID=UPI0006F9137A|nr:M14 family metallopeptidase [Burkholderia sp. Leaf177]KQR77092.1 succinylglutamate desuccinylase [Burkholderia sp. Leaf177]
MSVEIYPIEVAFPSIGRHEHSNTGIPFVHTFESGVAGPHVMINSLTHGNEVCGAIVIDALLRGKLRPRRGRLTLAFANVAAYKSFDPSSPDAARFVDQDFNRVWTSSILDDAANISSELCRARDMRPLIDTVDLLLDLHSMHEASSPLIVAGPLEKGEELSCQVGVPATVICDHGHPEGRRLRDYEGFGNPDSPKNALLIECGQHWAAEAVVVAKDVTARFLVSTGVVDTVDLPSEWTRPLEPVMRVVRVTEPVVANSYDFRFADAYTGLELFEKAGTIIGWSNGEPVRTPYDQCVLVMPSLRQLRPGVTVVRFGKLAKELRLPC